MPDLRTTRHIAGDYTLKETDTYRHFDDSIAAICDFDRRDYLFEVPFRTLINHDFPNIITAGRSASAEGYAWDVVRVLAPAITTGQAAAMAACLTVGRDIAICDVDVKELQQKLTVADVPVHFDDALVPNEAK